MGKKKEEKKRPASDSSDSSDSDSGPDDRNEPASKKSKGSASSSSSGRKNESGETYFELERGRRVTVREFKGKLYVDIREFYEKDGKMNPGKKGISLSTTQWNKFKALIGEVDEAIQDIA